MKRPITAKIVEMEKWKKLLIPRTTKYEMMKKKMPEKAEPWLIEEVSKLSRSPLLEERMKSIQIIGKTFKSLGEKSRLETLKIFRRTAEDKEIMVRQRTALTLGETKYSKTLSILEKMSADNKSRVRSCAVFALEKMGSGALPVLERIVKKEKNPVVLHRVRIAIEKIKGIR